MALRFCLASATSWMQLSAMSRGSLLVGSAGSKLADSRGAHLWDSCTAFSFLILPLLCLNFASSSRRCLSYSFSAAQQPATPHLCRIHPRRAQKNDCFVIAARLWCWVSTWVQISSSFRHWCSALLYEASGILNQSSENRRKNQDDPSSESTLLVIQAKLSFMCVEEEAL